MMNMPVKTVRCFFALLALCCCVPAQNQCPNDNTLTFASPQNLTPSGIGNTATNTQVWAGEYVIVNTTAGVEYRFSSCLTGSYNTYLTLIRASNGSPLVWANANTCNTNSEQIDWLSTYTGETRLLLDQWNGSSCASNGTNSTLAVTQLTALPVEMTRFTAAATRHSILLDWSTASERNNKQFVIMRGTDGKNFQEITSVEGVGDSDINVEYTYEDKNVEANTVYYYYLRQEDHDGTSSNTHVVTSMVKDNKRLFLGNLSPNPVEHHAILRYNAPAQPVRFKILDVAGRVRYDQTFPSTQLGLNEFGISPDLMGLSPGLYYLKVSSGNDSFAKQFLVAGK